MQKRSKVRGGDYCIVQTYVAACSNDYGGHGAKCLISGGREFRRLWRTTLSKPICLKSFADGQSIWRDWRETSCHIQRPYSAASASV